MSRRDVGQSSCGKGLSHIAEPALSFRPGLKSLGKKFTSDPISDSGSTAHWLKSIPVQWGRYLLTPVEKSGMITTTPELQDCPYLGSHSCIMCVFQTMLTSLLVESQTMER